MVKNDKYVNEVKLNEETVLRTQNFEMRACGREGFL